MPFNFRKLRIGFICLTLSFTKGQGKALQESRKAIDYLEGKLDVEVIRPSELISERIEARKVWMRFNGDVALNAFF